MTDNPNTSMLPRLITDAKAVVDAVTRDDCGQMVGQIWMGGNGGLLSRDTIKAVDKLRLTLSGAKAIAIRAETDEAGK